MALSGIFSTAVSGLTAFSSQLGNISENVANSSTVGFKELDTNFNSFVAAQNNVANTANGVLTSVADRNDIQGALASSANNTAIAINGNGFLPVQQPFVQGTTNVFTGNNQFTRSGDFSFNAQGYLVNPQGQYLMGNAPISGATTNSPTFSNVAQLGTLTPVQLSSSNRVSLGSATSNVTYNVNFPAGSTTAQSTQIQVFDSLGNALTIPLTWTPTAATNTWTVTTTNPTGVTVAGGPVAVVFNTDGTLLSVNGSTAAGTFPLTLTYTAATYGSNPTSGQVVTVNMGTPSSPAGTLPGAAGYVPGTGSTQFAGTTLQTRSSVIDGQAAGSFQSASIDSSGYVVFGYSNGAQVRQYRIPVFTFPDDNSLTRVSGSLFAQSIASGAPQPRWSGEQDAGKLLGGTLEQSNVDISAEFTKLIIAQRSYSANAKVVTTADEVTQEALNLKR